MDRFIIIGGGQCGAVAARTLRSEGFDGTVTIVSDETCVPYERPPLSKAVLLGDASGASTALFSADELRDLKIELISGKSAVFVDRDRGVVELSSGEALGFDRLLIATGSRPRVLDGPLSGKRNVFYLRTIDDAENLRAAMTPGKTLLSVGAGWIGLEVAASARKMGLKAVVVDVADRLCARSLPAEVAALLEDLHRDRGADIHLNTGLADVAGTGSVDSVTLSSGEVLAVDIVVVGIGVVPNTELACDAGLEIDNGVVVDRFLRTSDPRIFAAGDVAALRRDDGSIIRLESWANAQDQGAVAAQNMLGGQVPYVVNTWFWSDQYDVNIQMVGDLQSADSAVYFRRGDNGAFTRFTVTDGVVVGAVSFGMPREMAIVRRMVARRCAVRGDALETAPDLRKLL